MGRILKCELREEGVTPDIRDAETAGIERERRSLAACKVDHA